MQAESPQVACHSEGGSVKPTMKDAGGWCHTPLKQPVVESSCAC